MPAAPNLPGPSTPCRTRARLAMPAMTTGLRRAPPCRITPDQPCHASSGQTAHNLAPPCLPRQISPRRTSPTTPCLPRRALPCRPHLARTAPRPEPASPAAPVVTVCRRAVPCHATPASSRHDTPHRSESCRTAPSHACLANFMPLAAFSRRVFSRPGKSPRVRPASYSAA